MSSDFEFLLKALIKDKFNKIVIEDISEWTWIRFFNDTGRRFDFKFKRVAR